MIRLPDNIQPARKTLDQLEKWQAEVTGKFSEMVELATHNFKQRNRRGNQHFEEIKNALSKMCSGAARCVYCEDSAASEIEHIAPKRLYPEKVFVWENYVYSCGTCNGYKGVKFAVFNDNNGRIITHHSDQWSFGTPPPSGRPVMINPRAEDPMQFAILDIGGTFLFVSAPDNNEENQNRYEFTFNDVLRLNYERENLRSAREEAYNDYKARLLVYAQKRRLEVPQFELEKIIEQLRKKGHPTVWKEMQRWYRAGLLIRVDTELNALFYEYPEALEW